jgi:pyruvate dehydrogenase E1 component alpha subunit
MPPSPEILKSMFRKMVLARRFEEKTAQAYSVKKIQGFCHLYIGQEAVLAGCVDALNPDDYLMTGYRDHAHPLMRGAHPGMVMAELFARGQGYSKGKGGSMHLYDVEHYYFGGYGIVGGQIPLAAGMAFASKYRNEGRVAVCFFGDAAANQGSFHETFNMAAKWKLPVIYVCENNRYGMGTDIARVSGQPEIHQRASAYKMRGESCDGMDAIASWEAFKDCADHARSGKGPVLLEAFTYRFRGHSMSDAATYRTKEEVEDEKQNDPIPKLRAVLVKKKIMTEAECDEVDTWAKHESDEAIKFADASPPPALEELWDDHLIEGDEPDTRPRERALGAKDVVWPDWNKRFEVTWDLEPKSAPGPKAARKGAA